MKTDWKKLVEDTSRIYSDTGGLIGNPVLRHGDCRVYILPSTEKNPERWQYTIDGQVVKEYAIVDGKAVPFRRPRMTGNVIDNDFVNVA